MYELAVYVGRQLSGAKEYDANCDQLHLSLSGLVERPNSVEDWNFFVAKLSHS